MSCASLPFSLQKSPAPFQPSAARAAAFSSPDPTAVAAAAPSPPAPAVSVAAAAGRTTSTGTIPALCRSTTCSTGAVPTTSRSAAGRHSIDSSPNANGLGNKRFDKPPPGHINHRCCCSNCNGAGKAVKTFNFHKTEDETFQYHLLKSEDGTGEVLFVKTCSSTVTHPTTGDAKQIPGAWIKVDELVAKWIMNPPTKKGVHLSWTIGGVFCESHFAKIMRCSDEYKACCDFLLSHGIHLMHLPELRYIATGECVTDVADYLSILFCVFLHGEPLRNTYATKGSGVYARNDKGTIIETTIRYLHESIKNVARYCRSKLSPTDLKEYDDILLKDAYVQTEIFPGPWEWDKFSIVELDQKFPGLIDVFQNLHRACFSKLLEMEALPELEIFTFGIATRASFVAMGLVETLIGIGCKIRGVESLNDDGKYLTEDQSREYACHPSHFTRGGNSKPLILSYIRDVAALPQYQPAIDAAGKLSDNQMLRIVQESKKSTTDTFEFAEFVESVAVADANAIPSATASTDDTATICPITEASSVSLDIIEGCIKHRQAVVNENKWRAHFNQLVEFKRKYGHCNVPQRFKEIPGLGRWVSKQREVKSNLSNERSNALDSIEFEWILKGGRKRK